MAYTHIVLSQNSLTSNFETGDCLVVVGNLWVRFLTAESFSHVAIVLVEDEQVYVVETHEKINDTKKVLYDEWQKSYKKIFLGKPIKSVRDNRQNIQKKIEEYLAKPPDKKKYGYLTLPKVWLNQIFPGKRFQHRLNVCSTFVGEIWRYFGWSNGGKLADPGDIALSCDALYKLKG